MSCNSVGSRKFWVRRIYICAGSSIQSYVEQASHKIGVYIEISMRSCIRSKTRVLHRLLLVYKTYELEAKQIPGVTSVK
jgi:hypothetical protein